MKYMLLIYADENIQSDAEREQCYRESTTLAHELAAKGQYVSASPLQPTPTAANVRVRAGKPVITDGPFAETREQLGGYFIVDVENRDEALRIAARIPAARFGTVEIRSMVEIPDLPATRSIEDASVLAH
jgi:hypothetical protein